VIHNFTVWLDELPPAQREKIVIQDGYVAQKFRRYFKGKETGAFKSISKMDVVGICLPHDKNNVLNLLAGLYDCDDKKERKNWIEIKRNGNKKLWFAKEGE